MPRSPATDAVRPDASTALSRLVGNRALGALLQRACACGSGTGGADACDHCAHERSADGAGAVPPAVDEVVRTPGQPLDAVTSARMGERFGHDFSGVRVHTDAHAAQSARAVNALAYTIGEHIVFGDGQFAPGSAAGRRLAAHELAHVVQQSGGRRAGVSPARADLLERDAHAAADAAVGGVGPVGVEPAGGVWMARTPVLGTRFTQPPGAKSKYTKIAGRFDGATFTLTGDGAALFAVPAQSGRPYTVRPSDAAACGGKPDDTYLNNPRYVGIADNGPIPEGTYQFRASQLATFSTTEQWRMIGGGSFTDPFGVSLHGGDWGAGRVPLAPISIVPGAKGCGSTRTRSGFFLHGGSLPGSSGCIDVGNDGVAELVKALAGYTGTIVVTVKYTAPPPTVGAAKRAVGRFTYPKAKDPSLWDRLKAAADLED